MPPLVPLPLAAAKLTPWEQLRQVPTQVWLNVGICVLAVIVLVRVWRVLKRFNEFAPYIAAALASALIFFYWVYERSEPAFLTPLVNRIAPFFPSGADQKRQADKARKSGD